MPALKPKEFFIQFLTDPKHVGAVAPSSRTLARRVADRVDWSAVEAVLEYGPGTGVVTEEILRRLRPGAKFVAIELNPEFVAIVKERFPDLAVAEASVEDVRAVCDGHGIDQVDAILSGLPWASFTDEEQTRCLDAMMTVLKPQGQFVTFGYLQGLVLPAGIRFRSKLRRYFASVRMSRPIWPNLPPAFLYDCRRGPDAEQARPA